MRHRLALRVTKFTGVFACGRVLNMKAARSQLIGSITWGIGIALICARAAL